MARGGEPDFGIPEPGLGLNPPPRLRVDLDDTLLDRAVSGGTVPRRDTVARQTEQRGAAVGGGRSERRLRPPLTPPRYGRFVARIDRAGGYARLCRHWYRMPHGRPADEERFVARNGVGSRWTGEAVLRQSVATVARMLSRRGDGHRRAPPPAGGVRHARSADPRVAGPTTPRWYSHRGGNQRHERLAAAQAAQHRNRWSGGRDRGVGRGWCSQART